MARYTVIVLALIVCTLAGAQDKPAPKPIAPAPGTPVTDKDAQIKLLQAERNFRGAQADMASLEAQYQSLQSQMNQLKLQGPAAQKKVADAQAELEKEVTAAGKAIGVDYPARYDFNFDTNVYSPKASPALNTPSPEKK